MARGRLAQQLFRRGEPRREREPPRGPAGRWSLRTFGSMAELAVPVVPGRSDGVNGDPGDAETAARRGRRRRQRWQAAGPGGAFRKARAAPMGPDADRVVAMRITMTGSGLDPDREAGRIPYRHQEFPAAFPPSAIVVASVPAIASRLATMATAAGVMVGMRMLARTRAAMAAPLSRSPPPSRPRPV